MALVKSYTNIPEPTHQPPINKGEILPKTNTDAKIAAVGEAPARVEELRRKFFVGPAGYVLDQCIHAAGLARAEIYLTNFLKIRPPSDRITDFCDPKNRKRTISQQGRYWRDKLVEELKSIDANVIVLCGNIPLYLLTEKVGIHKWRGSLLESELVPGKKFLPTIHPASVTYGDFISRYHIVQDFKLAKTESDYPEIRLPKRNYIINPSWGEAIDYVKAIHKSGKLVSFDIETAANEVSCISFSTDPTEAISIPIQHYSASQEAACWRAIGELLEDEDIPKVGQNLIFDTQFLLSHNSILTKGHLEDTMIAHHILYPDFPKGLDFLVSYHCNGEPYYKDEGKQWKLSAIKDWPQFWTYNAKDAALTLEVWHAIKGQIQQNDFYDTYRFHMDMYDPINFMVLRGIKVDKEAIAKAQVLAQSKISENQDKLKAIIGDHFTEKFATSSTQCQKYFYGHLGIPPLTRYNKATGKSSPTMDDKALQSLVTGSKARKPLKEASLIQKIRGDKKLLTTYLTVDLDPDDRFRCSYDLRGTTTGRYSSRKTITGTGMNHQNLPKEFRGYLVPDEGKIFIEWDKRQAEWVVVAYYCGDGNMIHIIENDLDAHLISGSMISRLPLEYCVLEDDYVGDERDPDNIEAKRRQLEIDHPEWNRTTFAERFPGYYLPRTYSIRSIGKHSNHGFNYDMSGRRFAEEYEVEVEEGELVAGRYYGTYSGIKRGHAMVVDELKENRYLVNCYNRKRKFFGEWGKDLFKSAYDFIPQSTVVDNTNRGILRCYHDPDSFMKPLESLLQVHDAGVGQYPIANLMDMSKMILRGVEHFHDELEYHGRKFSIKTDVKIGFNWKDMIELPDLTRYSPARLAEELKSFVEQARDKAA